VDKKNLRRHETRQKIIEDRPNGFMLPLWNDSEDFPFDTRFIYATTCNPFTVKGPYCHTKRSGLLCVIFGKIVYVHKKPGEHFFQEEEIDADTNPVRFLIPVGEEYCFIGLGDKEALLINICDYPWKAGDNETLIPDFSEYHFEKWIK